MREEFNLGNIMRILTERILERLKKHLKISENQGETYWSTTDVKEDLQ